MQYRARLQQGSSGQGLHSTSAGHNKACPSRRTPNQIVVRPRARPPRGGGEGVVDCSCGFLEGIRTRFLPQLLSAGSCRDSVYGKPQQPSPGGECPLLSFWRGCLPEGMLVQMSMPDC